MFFAVDCKTKLNMHMGFSKLRELLSVVILWNAGQIADISTLKEEHSM